MAYNKQNYQRVREVYRTKYLLAEEEATRRTEELHRKSPELRAIDRVLSKTGIKIAMAALGTGDEYKEKLAEVGARIVLTSYRMGGAPIKEAYRDEKGILHIDERAFGDIFGAYAKGGSL